jgi:chain length determinant protein tyrosine kinase EpsG
MEEPTATEVLKFRRDRSRALGAILVELGRINPDDVDKIQLLATQRGLRFGDAAVQLNLLSPADVEYALAQQFQYPILQRGGDGGVSADVIAGYAPHAQIVEPLRAIRSQLILRWFNGASRKILAVASPERREGRSWFAANLATMFAQVGERTLLIDGDMRHPRQHELFNIRNEVGLSALLTGRAGRECVRRIHPQLRLFVLPAGMRPPNPQELLERMIFDVVINNFAQQYNIVIFDTPAVMETADAQIVTAISGGTVMVARRNHTRHRALSAAVKTLTETGANVVGSVITAH